MLDHALGIKELVLHLEALLILGFLAFEPLVYNLSVVVDHLGDLVLLLLEALLLGAWVLEGGVEQGSLRLLHIRVYQTVVVRQPQLALLVYRYFSVDNLVLLDALLILFHLNQLFYLFDLV